MASELGKHMTEWGILAEKTAPGGRRTPPRKYLDSLAATETRRAHRDSRLP